MIEFNPYKKYQSTLLLRISMLVVLLLGTQMAYLLFYFPFFSLKVLSAIIISFLLWCGLYQVSSMNSLVVFINVKEERIEFTYPYCYLKKKFSLHISEIKRIDVFSASESHVFEFFLKKKGISFTRNALRINKQSNEIEELQKVINYLRNLGIDVTVKDVNGEEKGFRVFR